MYVDSKKTSISYH